MKTSSISYARGNESVADYHTVRRYIIRDKEQRRKRGVSDYQIRAIRWGGKWMYFAEIEATWVNFDDCRPCATMREASARIRRYVYGDSMRGRQ